MLTQSGVSKIVSMQPLYKFMAPEPIHFTPDIETPDTPGSLDPNVYGPVIHSFGNIHVRFLDGLWSQWAGPKLLHTTRDREVAGRYFKS